MNSVETRFVEGPVAPLARAQRREEDDQGVVAAPVARRVAPRAGVRLVEAVAAADACELARDRLELLRLPVVVAVREDAARANVRPRLMVRRSTPRAIATLTASGTVRN